MSGTYLGGSPPIIQAISANTLRCIAALACGVSLALTLRFCLGLRIDDDLAATALAAAMAVCLEAAKWTFSAAGAACMRSSRPTHVAGGTALCLISLALLICSVGASISYLQQRSSELRERALTRSRSFRDLNARLQGLDSELTTLRQTAAQDAEHGYRARALRTLEAARRLAEQRAALAAQLSASATDASAAASASVLHPLAGAVGVDATRLQMLVHLAIALLLEAIGIASVLLLRSQNTGAAHAVQPQPADAGPRAVPEHAPATSAPNAVAVQPDADAYARCRDLILAGSIRPSHRAIQRAMHVGQARARRFLHALCGEGVLAKAQNGRGFRVQMNLA